MRAIVYGLIQQWYLVQLIYLKPVDLEPPLSKTMHICWNTAMIAVLSSGPADPLRVSCKARGAGRTERHACSSTRCCEGRE